MHDAEAAKLTYRYLRISIVVLAVYLGISVGIETRFDGDRWLGRSAPTTTRRFGASSSEH